LYTPLVGAPVGREEESLHRSRSELADDAAGNDGLRRVVVELQAEGEEEMVEIAMLRGEVEAENMARWIDWIGLLLCFDGDIAEEAGLGGVGGSRDLAGCFRHGN